MLPHALTVMVMMFCLLMSMELRSTSRLKLRNSQRELPFSYRGMKWRFPEKRVISTGYIVFMLLKIVQIRRVSMLCRDQ